MSFDDPRLTADEIAKDIGLIRFLLGSVVRPAPNGAATRFVAGIVSAPAGAQPGISAAALRERLAHEPARFVTILSPLITERELAATLALVEALDAQGRDFWLIVPEWYPDNKTIRADAAARARPLCFAGAATDADRADRPRRVLQGRRLGRPVGHGRGL